MLSPIRAPSNTVKVVSGMSGGTMGHAAAASWGFTWEGERGEWERARW